MEQVSSFFLLFFSGSLIANEIPTHNIKNYVEKQAVALLEKESISINNLTPTIAASLDKRIHQLINKLQKKYAGAIDKITIDQSLKQLIEQFAKETQQSITAKDVEKLVNTVLNKFFVKAGFSIAAIPPTMKAEYLAKKEYVLTSLKKIAGQTSLTMADISVALHTTFDQFIERVGYMHVSETGKQLIAILQKQKKRPKCSALIVPEPIKETLRSLVLQQQNHQSTLTSS